MIDEADESSCDEYDDDGDDQQDEDGDERNRHYDLSDTIIDNEFKSQPDGNRMLLDSTFSFRTR